MFARLPATSRYTGNKRNIAIEAPNTLISLRFRHFHSTEQSGTRKNKTANIKSARLYVLKKPSKTLDI